MGSTTIICSDKTGTLTQNEMTVVKVFTDGKIIDVTGGGYEPTGDFKLEGENIKVEDIGDLQTLLSISALANDADLEKTSMDIKLLEILQRVLLVTLAGKGNINKHTINNEVSSK